MIQHEDARAQFLGLVHQVSRVQYGNPELLLETPHEPPHPGGSFRIELYSRFVQEKDLVLRRQRASNSQTLPQSARGAEIDTVNGYDRSSTLRGKADALSDVSNPEPDTPARYVSSPAVSLYAAIYLLEVSAVEGFHESTGLCVDLRGAKNAHRNFHELRLVPANSRISRLLAELCDSFPNKSKM